MTNRASDRPPLRGVPTFRPLGRTALQGTLAVAHAVTSGACSGPALGTTPGGRAVLRVVVERPLALGAHLEAGPHAVLLRREHDRDQAADRVVQCPRLGREQL